MRKLICGMPRPVFFVWAVLSYGAFRFIHGFVPIAGVIGGLYLIFRLLGKWDFNSFSTVVDGILAPPVHAAAQRKRGGR